MWSQVFFLTFTVGLVTTKTTIGDSDLGCNDATHFRYRTEQKGLFLQEDPSVNPNPPDFAKVNLGLINRTYETDSVFDPYGQKTQWERFAFYVRKLNDFSDVDTQYKVLYLARHGQAVHNVMQSSYGQECWDCFWSQQVGNGEFTWLDAALTQVGEAQALVANKFWMDSLNTTKVPLPQSFYTSPMQRCLKTANFTFSTLPTQYGQNFKPTIKELLRETINQCTCAWRNTKSWIHERFPSYSFEAGFSENDTLWKAGFVESSSAQTLRLRTLLDDVFATDRNTFISFTTHGANLPFILDVIGHPNPKFNITTGQVIPVLVKAEKMESAAVTTSVEPPSPAPTCTIRSPRS